MKYACVSEDDDIVLSQEGKSGILEENWYPRRKTVYPTIHSC